MCDSVTILYQKFLPQHFPKKATNQKCPLKLSEFIPILDLLSYGGSECAACGDDVRVRRRAAGTQPLRYLQSGRRRCLPVAARAASSAAPGVFTRARAPSERGVWTGAGRLRGRGQAVLALTVLTQRYLLCSLTPGALRTMLRRRMGNSTHGGRKPQRHGRERRGSGASIMASSRSRSRLGSNHNCTHNSIA